MKDSMEIPQNIKNRITIWSNISTPGYLSEENKLIRKDICTSTVTAALFTIAKIQKPPKDISVDMDKGDVVYVYNRTLFIHEKNEILPLAATWKDLNLLC